MNILNEALKIQTDALKAQDKIDQERRAEIQLKVKQFEKFKATVEAFVNKFKDFNSMPVSFYKYSEDRSQYRYLQDTYGKVEIRYQNQGYGSHSSDTFQTYSCKRDEPKDCHVILIHAQMYMLIKEDGKGLKIQFYRTSLTFDEVKHLLLPDNKAWACERGDTPFYNVNTVFSDAAKAYDHIKSILLKLANIEELKKLNEQTERKTILAKHLGLDSTDGIEFISNGYNRNPHGELFKIKETEYRVLDKYEVPEWYAYMVSKDVRRHADLGLLTDASGLSYEELKTMHEKLKPETFNILVGYLSCIGEYSKAMAKKYSFSQYVVSVDSYYVVDLTKLNGV